MLTVLGPKPDTGIGMGASLAVSVPYMALLFFSSSGISKMMMMIHAEVKTCLSSSWIIKHSSEVTGAQSDILSNSLIWELICDHDLYGGWNSCLNPMVYHFSGGLFTCIYCIGTVFLHEFNSISILIMFTKWWLEWEIFSNVIFLGSLFSQGTTGTVGRHLPAAEGKQGNIWGCIRGRYGGAAQTLLHLRPPFAVPNMWGLIKDYSRHQILQQTPSQYSVQMTTRLSYTVHSILNYSQVFLTWHAFFVVLCCFVALVTTKEDQRSWTATSAEQDLVNMCK